MSDERWLQIALVVGYAAVLAHHARAGRRVSGSAAGYLVAGRDMGGVVIAISFFATFMSTNTFIGAAGRSWDLGLSWCLGGIVLTALAVVSWTVVAPRFVPLTRAYDSLTLADFLGSHYGSPAVRRAAGGIVAFASILYLIAIYRGASLAIEQFVGLPYTLCVVLTCAVVTAYTLAGGFKSVVLTDALQGVLMLVGAVAISVAVVVKAGGPAELSMRLDTLEPRFSSWTHNAGLGAAATYALAVGLKYLVEPRQLSRFYGLRDAAALRTAMWIAPLAICVSYVCLLPLGAIARLLIPPDAITSTDQVVPYLLGPAEILGPLLGTVFLLVLVSAALSSIDSVLLVAASSLDRDVLRQAESGRSHEDTPAEVRATQVWIVVLSLVAAGSALVPSMQDIIRMTKFSGSLYAACFLPVFVVGLFVTRRSAHAALLTMAAGACVTVAVFALRMLGYTSLQEVYPGIATGLGVYAVATRFSRETAPAPSPPGTS